MSTEQSNPYAPPEATVGDIPGVTEAVEPAGRGTRLGAAIVDGLIWIAIYMPVIMGMDLSAATPDLSGVSATAALTSFVLAIAWAAYTIYLVHLNGQTIGKKLLGIKVVRSNGSRAALSRIFWLRNVVNALPAAIPFVGSLYVLVDHLFIFGEKRQCLHDKIADTIVVKA